jgi:two-component system LytT family response regulator
VVSISLRVSLGDFLYFVKIKEVNSATHNLKSMNTPYVADESQKKDKIVFQSGRQIWFIETEKITFIEACNYYALIHADGKTIVVRESLDEIEARLSNHSFLRVHRSIILNLNIFQCMERKDNGLIVRTTIGRDFKVSRHRVKSIRNKILS